MVRYYRELTRLEMEAVDKEETVVLIPIGALEQHGNQCPLGTDEIISEAVAPAVGEHDPSLRGPQAFRLQPGGVV